MVSRSIFERRPETVPDSVHAAGETEAASPQARLSGVLGESAIPPAWRVDDSERWFGQRERDFGFHPVQMRTANRHHAGGVVRARAAHVCVVMEPEKGIRRHTAGGMATDIFSTPRLNPSGPFS
jgi:hypothetical protein